MSDFKARLKKNEKLIGTMLSELYSANIPVLLKSCGFDYFIVDCEHGCFDYSVIASLAAVSKAADIPMIVRIPVISRECILKYMDAGVDGLLVPMVAGAEDMKRVVEYSKYAPMGKRGISTTRAHTGYKNADMAAHMRQSNDETVILAQIECVKGLENVKSISEVTGVDGLIVGPNDLTYDLGIGGQYDNVVFKDAVRKTIACTREAGKFSGVISSNIDLLVECMDSGMQIVSWNSELGMIVRSATGCIKELKSKIYVNI